MQDNWETVAWVLASISPFLLALLAGVGWLYRHERERREAVERQLSEKKYRAYIALVDIFFDVMKDMKESSTIDQKVVVRRMMDANKELMLFGSDEVVSTYQRWLTSARNEKPVFAQFAQLIIAMRRDMGNHKTNMTPDDVLRSLITDYDKAKQSGQLS